MDVTPGIEPGARNGESHRRDAPVQRGVVVQESCARYAQWPEELIRARAEAAYWRSMHRNAVIREQKLKAEIDELNAKLKQRERELFSRKSERRGRNKGEPLAAAQDESRRSRGHQRGRPGHGRRHHTHLPEVVEVWDLEQDKKHCVRCQCPFEPLACDETSEEVEIEVRAHRRVIKRKRYQPTCDCAGQPRIITTPGPPKLITQGGYGVSFWVTVLLDKFLFQRPTYRLLNELELVHGLEVSPGTVTGGLKYVMPLFAPLYEALIEKNIADTRWHADETRWFVFADEPGKQGHRWYLWVFQSTSSVVFKLDPSRSAEVPVKHFGEQAEGILNVDRYAAYKVLLDGGRIVLAFCWAHVRRDYLTLAKTRQEHQAWGLGWVERIAHLYGLNKQRVTQCHVPERFAAAQCALEEAVEEIATERDRELAEPQLSTPRRKVLESLKNHWSGLTVFVDYPEVAMDNNAAERTLRNPIIGRKNYYGSGARWSGELAMMLFSLFQTLLLHGLNPRTWLTTYLQACRGCHGQAPAHASHYLPWHLSARERRRMTQPLAPAPDTS